MTSPDPTQRPHRSAPDKILLWLVAGLVAIIGSNIYLFENEHQNALRQSDLASRNLVDSLAYKTQATMDKIDMLAGRLAADFSGYAISSPNLTLERELLQIAEKNPDIALIALLDASGQVFASNLPVGARRTDLSDLSFFDYHRAHNDDTLLIGTPMISRLTGKPVIPVTRRVNDRYGKMAGIIYLPLAADFLLTELENYAIGPHGFIAINANRHVLLRHPNNRFASGIDLSKSPLYSKYYDRAESGQFNELSPIDSKKRRYSFRNVPHYPMVVVTGVSEVDLFPSWLPSALGKLSYGLILSGALAFIAYHAQRRLDERSRAEQRARDALAEIDGYRQALDEHVVTARLDMNGRVIAVNDKFCLLSGFRRDELIGQPLPLLDGRIDDPIFTPILRNALSTRSAWRGIRCARDKEGSTYWLETCLLPMPGNSDRPIEFLLAQTDITGVKLSAERAELVNQALASTLDLKFAILNSTECGIIATNPQGAIVLFNAAAEKLLGYSNAEVGQLTPVDFHFRSEIDALFSHLREEDRPVPDNFACVASAIRDARRTEWSYRRRDRSVMPVSLVITPQRARDGSVRGYVIVFNDLTASKRLDQLKSDFVSVVSHELRTPLTSIKGSMALLRSGTSVPLDATQHKLLDIAATNCDKLVKLVSDILDLDKMERQQMVLDRVVQPLQPLLEKSLAMTQPYADQFGVHYELDVTAATPLAPAAALASVDADRFLQVMSNLLSNAAKFSPPGGKVRISLSREGDYLQIEVHDQGEGIPAAFHDRVFEKFTQSRSALTRTRAGSGLGLSIAKAIIDVHGGEIWFRSEPVTGTSFYLQLPAAPPVMADAA